MVRINGNTITITRGDTLDATLELFTGDGAPYEAQEGDSIRFALKRRYSDKDVLLLKDIPTATMRLRLESEETRQLKPAWAPYVYDIQLTAADGTVDTFSDRGRFIVTEEVE